MQDDAAAVSMGLHVRHKPSRYNQLDVSACVFSGHHHFHGDSIQYTSLFHSFSVGSLNVLISDFRSNNKTTHSGFLCGTPSILLPSLKDIFILNP